MRNPLILILVATHKEAYVFENRIIRQIQVGTACAVRRLPNMLHDDDGRNISYKNRSYCEMTAQYYAWQNLEADYYGFFHYRRYMNFAKEYPVAVDGIHKKHLFGISGRIRRPAPYSEADSLYGDLSDYAWDEKHMQSVVEKYDVITVPSEHMGVTVYEQFCQFHDKADLDRMIQILKKDRPEYAEACDVYMQQNHIYFCNLYIMKREYFTAYMEWIFPLLEAFEEGKDFKGCGTKQMRVTGYLAERLFGVYYTWLKMQGKAKCCELPYVIFRKENIRQFSIGKGRKFRVDMRKVNRLLPAGSLRRRMVRRLLHFF